MKNNFSKIFDLQIKLDNFSANNGTPNLPVLFWLHGGYYAYGSGCEEK